MHTSEKSRNHPLLLRESYIVSGRTNVLLPEAGLLPKVQDMGVRKVWAQSHEQNKATEQHVSELRSLSGIQAKIQEAKAELQDSQKKLQDKNTLFKDLQCGLNVLREQMDTAKEEVAMWQQEAEATQKIVASLRSEHSREVRAIRSSRSAADSEYTYTSYLVDKQGQKAYEELVKQVKRHLAKKKKLQEKFNWLYLEGNRLCNKTEQHREALPDLEMRLANLDEAIQAKKATLAELDKVETEKFAKLDSVEYLLAATSDKLKQQHEQAQALNLEIERLKVVQEACKLQSGCKCRPNGSTESIISTQSQGAAPAPEGLCISSRCSLADAPSSNSSVRRAANTARVHDRNAGTVDSRYTDLESLCDGDVDCQVHVLGSKRDGQQQVSHRCTFKSLAAKAKDACKKLLIKRNSSKGDSGPVRSSSSSKVGSNGQVNPDDMLSATIIWRWATDRNSRYNDTPMYVKPGDLQMMLDSPPVGGHAPNSGVPPMW